MAELFRVTRLNDYSQNQTFTFSLPPATSADTPPEISSRDFLYAGHRWRLSLFKKDKHLSPYLLCTNLCRGLRCNLDFSLVLINRESFTQNESFSDKQKLFESSYAISSSSKSNLAQEGSPVSINKDRPAHEPANSHGRRTFITLMDIRQRNFADDRGDFLLEVNVKNPRTVFEYNFHLNKPKLDLKTNSTIVDYQRYDTNVFTYGDMDWQCTFCPNMETSDDGKMRHMIQIVRKNKAELLCKLSYKLTLGTRNSTTLSFRRHEIFDFSGSGQSPLIYFDRDYCSLVDVNFKLKLTLELYGLVIVNHLRFSLDDDISTKISNSTNSPKISTTPKHSARSSKIVTQTFSDKDKQTWSLSVQPNLNFKDDFLSLTLQYADCQNIPKNYSRYVSWNVNLLPIDRTKSVIRPIFRKNSPFAFENFYTQTLVDKAYPISMDIRPQELRDNAADWLDDIDGRFTIEIEWLSSHLLFQPNYSINDDVYRKHIVQMRREINALQLENSDLEKELFKYQISIGKKFTSNEGQLDRPLIGDNAVQQAASTPRSQSMGGETDRRVIRRALIGDRNLKNHI